MKIIRYPVILIVIVVAAALAVQSRGAFGQNAEETVETSSVNAMVENAVSAAAEEAPQPAQEAEVQKFTMVFELTSAKASELSEKVQPMLTENVGKVKFDETSNKLIVTDTASKIEEIRKLVDTIDQRDRQVTIETKIVQIVLNDEHRMGVDWEAIVSDYHSLSLVGRPGHSSEGEKRGKLSIGTIAHDDYSVLMDALDTVGDVNILSNPVITTVTNKEARILTGLTQSFPAATAPSSGLSTTTESARFVDVGVKLFVTPMVHADGLIAMKIRPDSVAGSTAADVPETEIMVNAKDGAVIVIGGLIKEEKARTIKKVPVLGDVPLLGMAFRSYGHSIKKTEVVIFLTPKIEEGK